MVSLGVVETPTNERLAPEGGLEEGTETSPEAEVPSLEKLQETLNRLQAAVNEQEKHRRGQDKIISRLTASEAMLLQENETLKGDLADYELVLTHEEGEPEPALPLTRKAMLEALKQKRLKVSPPPSPKETSEAQRIKDLFEAHGLDWASPPSEIQDDYEIAQGFFALGKFEKAYARLEATLQARAQKGKGTSVEKSTEPKLKPPPGAIAENLKGTGTVNRRLTRGDLDGLINKDTTFDEMKKASDEALDQFFRARRR